MTRKRVFSIRLVPLLALVLAQALICSQAARVALAEEAPAPEVTVTDQAPGAEVPIYDAAGLLAMAQNPTGSYRLMCDVDLAGIAWQPIEFAGTFDGGGHAILNALVQTCAATPRVTYDGNLISYDTLVSGFFGSLTNATVRNVELLGCKVDVTTTEPTFCGSLVGYMEDSLVEGCTVSGEVWLQTSGASFGVGGILGFGTGRVEGCVADVTLVCRDADAYTKDEQFMGGVYANGFADIVGNDVTIRGFDSDHGYVHDGGLAGMYIIYPEDTGEHFGEIRDNVVRGHITFFEDNEDRRAYCEAGVGELMNPWSVDESGNTDEFERDERFTYDVDLLPHDCGDPQWVEEAVASSCDARGYTQRTCTMCGYSERVSWVPTAHEVGEWAVVDGSEHDGMVARTGTCARCGQAVFEAVPAETVQQMEATEAQAQATVEAESRNPVLSLLSGMNPILLALGLVVALAAITLIIWVSVGARTR